MCVLFKNDVTSSYMVVIIRRTWLTRFSRWDWKDDWKWECW